MPYDLSMYFRAQARSTGTPISSFLGNKGFLADETSQMGFWRFHLIVLKFVVLCLCFAYCSKVHILFKEICWSFRLWMTVTFFHSFADCILRCFIDGRVLNCSNDVGSARKKSWGPGFSLRFWKFAVVCHPSTVGCSLVSVTWPCIPCSFQKCTWNNCFEFPQKSSFKLLSHKLT